MQLKFRVWEKGCFVDDPRTKVAYLHTEPNRFSLTSFDGVIQQWTGLTDSRGREIYEGDICHYVRDVSTPYGYDGLDTKKRFCDGLCEVVYSAADQGFRFGWGFKSDGFYANNDLKTDYESLEVAGNIFETPELLA